MNRFVYRGDYLFWIILMCGIYPPFSSGFSGPISRNRANKMCPFKGKKANTGGRPGSFSSRRSSGRDWICWRSPSGK